ncbi:OLC1v1003215C1 [Oldenlandia corymbosa var. corymbosa]|uniref:OLC1v1003215C1 n=1 Tax=Oldenlandia corymbosa var. corymbosa TaxID=529605 RepID=A0AAV1D9I4_OLDCO|nr:OLC1v1003215C1 [Oldenlandia corymbosa var. corymbosa]
MVDRRSKVVLLCFVYLSLLFNFSLEQTQHLLNSRVERLALLRLRSSLGLRAKEWPIKSDPCTLWAGIQCQNGRVVGINISGFKRTRIGGENPQFSVDALQNFTLLASFNASNFALPGSIPEWFGTGLPSLQVLDLRSCSIFGTIPSTLGNLTNLRSLYLSHNGLTGIVPSSLGQLLNLQILDLSKNSLTGTIPVSFVGLGNLTLLDMSVNYLTGGIPSGIGSLSRLQSLNISGNSLSSSIPAQLGDLSNLVDLDLGSNSLAGPVPSDLRGLRNLQRFLIGKNSLSESLPANLFPPLNKLQVVNLSHNAFTGELPAVLWSLSQLQSLDVSGNNFTGTLPTVSLNANASTAALNISDNMFYGGISSVIRRFSFADMSGNYFQGQVPDYAQNKVQVVENCLQNVTNQRSGGECSSFYAGKGLTFDNFGLTNTTQSPPSQKKSRRTKIILAAVLGGVVAILLLVVLIVLLMVCTRKRGSTNQRGIGVGPAPPGASPPSPGMPLNLSSLGDAFTYEQILLATGEFGDENLIKHGHSGDLFRGLLEGGIPVVVKKMDLQSVKKETCMLELDFFSKVSHPRIVPLLGHCLENENEKFLVYKFMPNGDLSSSLFRKTDSDDDSLQSLDWITRLKIAIGAAEALSYLHHECSPPFVHRDVQASSILLDDKFEVRLGSLTEVCAQEGDGHQNRISRLLRLQQTSEPSTSGTANATCAYDVYCFGKVLLELVTGKLGISASNDASSKDWLEQTLPYINIYDKDGVTKIIDPSLIIDEDLLEEVWAMAVVAKSCLNPKPARRPLMRYILKALENPLKVVREEHTSSARLRATSSRSSWNAALFGSWRSSSDVANVPVAPANKLEGGSSFKQSGTTGSQGSGHNGDGAHSSSTRRHSKEIFPEPMEELPDVNRPIED